MRDRGAIRPRDGGGDGRYGPGVQVARPSPPAEVPQRHSQIVGGSLVVLTTALFLAHHGVPALAGGFVAQDALEQLLRERAERPAPT